MLLFGIELTLLGIAGNVYLLFAGWFISFAGLLMVLFDNPNKKEKSEKE